MCFTLRGRRVSPAALFLASFCGTALGNAVGFGAFTAAAIRYRIYGAVGISSDQIARLLAFVFGAFALGLAVIGGLAALFEADAVANLIGWTPNALRFVAGVSLAAATCTVAFGLRGQIRIGGFAFLAPTKMLALGQFVLTSIRLIGAAAALWVLLPQMQVSFLGFAAIFSAATALGTVRSSRC